MAGVPLMLRRLKQWFRRSAEAWRAGQLALLACVDGHPADRPSSAELRAIEKDRVRGSGVDHATAPLQGIATVQAFLPERPRFTLRVPRHQVSRPTSGCSSRRLSAATTVTEGYPRPPRARHSAGTGAAADPQCSANDLLSGAQQGCANLGRRTSRSLARCGASRQLPPAGRSDN